MAKHTRRQSARSQSSRRRFCQALGTAAVAGVAGLAGCLRDGDALASTPSDDWPMHGYDAANTGHHPDTTGPTGSVSTTWSLDVDTSTTPAVVDGTIYGPGPDEVLGAVDAVDGSYEWRHGTSDRVETAVAVVNETVFASDRSGALYALDAADGEELWTERYVGSGMSPAVVDGTVYAGSYESTLAALDAETGERLWEFDERLATDSTEQHSLTDPAVARSAVYVADQDGVLYAVDASDGSELWSADVTEYAVLASPTVAGDTVYVGTQDNAVVALDAANGDELWRSATSDRVVGLAVANGRLYVADHALLVAFDAATGESLWEGSHGGWSYTEPVVADGTVYHGAGSGGVVAYDAATGEIEWEFETEIFESAGPTTPVVVDGVVFYGDVTGFYALTGEEN